MDEYIKMHFCVGCTFRSENNILLTTLVYFIFIILLVLITLSIYQQFLEIIDIRERTLCRNVLTMNNLRTRNGFSDI